MKNKDLYVALNNVAVLKGLTGAKFLIALKKARRDMQNEVDIIESLKTDNDKYNEFLKEQTELQEKYSVIENGKPKTETIFDDNKQPIGKKYIIKEDKIDEFNTKYNKLTKKYEHVLDDYISALELDTKYNKIKLASRYLPDNISFEQYEIVDLFLDIV